MASKIAGTYLRGGKVWLRIIAPKDLQAQFYDSKRIAFNGSLGTGDPQVACVKAAAIRADFEAQFLAQRREMSPPKLAAVGPELRQCIVGTLLAQDAERDAAQRLDKARSTGVYGPVVVRYEAEEGSAPDRPAIDAVPPLRPLATTTVSARAALNQ